MLIHVGEFSAILDELDSGKQPSEFFLQVVREQWEEMNSTSTEDIHIREDRHELYVPEVSFCLHKKCIMHNNCMIFCSH